MGKIKNFLNIFAIRLQWNKRNRVALAILRISGIAFFSYILYNLLNGYSISNVELVISLLIAFFGLYYNSCIKFDDKPSAKHRGNE